MMTLKNRNISERKSTNYNFINIIKFLFSIVVIAKHTHALEYIKDSTFKEMLFFVLSACVPFFFVCMGYSIAEKVDFYENNKKDLIRAKAVLNGLIKLYVVWNIIYFPLALVGYFKTDNSFIYNLFSYIKGLVLKGEHYNSWQLWFLLSFIYAFGFLYLCMKKRVPFKKMCIFSLLIGSLSILIKLFNIYELNCSFGLMNNILKLMKLTIDNGRIFTAFLYLPLGIVFQRRCISNRSCFAMVALSFAFLFFGGNIGQNIGKILISCSVFLLSIKVKIPNKYIKICDMLRDLSMSNYYIHMLVFSIYYAVVYGEPTYSIDCFIFTTIVSVLLGIFYIIYRKQPLSNSKIPGMKIR